MRGGGGAVAACLLVLVGAAAVSLVVVHQLGDGWAGSEALTRRGSWQGPEQQEVVRIQQQRQADDDPSHWEEVDVEGEPPQLDWEVEWEREQPVQRHKKLHGQACALQLVLMVSTGRTGSTMFMQALSRFRSTFAIPEPFRYWSKHDVSSSAPSYKQLFDCSFLNDTALANKVMWVFACNNNQHIAMDDGRRQRCYRGRMTDQDFAYLHRACLSSCVRIIKTIRDYMFGIDVPQAKELETIGYFHAMHLVRNPWASIVSKYNHGWKYRPDAVGIGGALRAECSRMLQSASLLNTFPRSRALSIRNEDLVKDIKRQLLRVLRHLRWNAFFSDHGIDEVVRVLQSREFASFKRNPSKPIQTTEKAALAWVRGHPFSRKSADPIDDDPCVKAYEQYNYNYPDI